MVLVPAIVWRGRTVSRGVTVGLGVGLFLGALAWLDSGLLLGGLIAAIVSGLGFGVWLGRQMARYWPGAKELTGEQRAAVVDAVRRGAPIGDAALTSGVLGYSKALHTAADKGRPLRWLLVIVLIVAVASSIWDAVYGSWGNAIASAIYLVMIGIELFWWPDRQAQLVANADRAVAFASQADS
jgi:hypothetical protein